MKFATWVQADCTLDFTGLDRQPKGMLRFFPLFVGALLGSFFLGQTFLAIIMKVRPIRSRPFW